MFNLVIKNNESKELLLTYKKDNNVLDLLKVDESGMLKIATNEAKRAYYIIDNIRKKIREDNLDLSMIVLLEATIDISMEIVNTFLKYLDKTISLIEIVDNKIKLEH